MSDSTFAQNNDNQPALSDEERAEMLAQSERVAWLPPELLERDATRWALAEGWIRLDEVPAFDPAGPDRVEQLFAFTAWAREHVMPTWEVEQTRKAVPLVCPRWCTERHSELVRPGVITPWDMGTTHESVELAPGTGLDVRVIQGQNHPDDGPAFGDVVLHVGGEIDLTTPAAVRDLAAAIALAAPVLERAQA